jgi:hypothetical protein
MVALIENSGFGGANAAPAVRAVYDVYYRKTRHEEPPGAIKPQIAKKESTDTKKPIARAAAAVQQTARNNR